MTNKEYLEQYAIYKESIAQAKESLKELEQGIDSISIDYSGMPHGSGIANRTEAYVIRMEEMREPILREIAEAYGIMMQIADSIRAVPNPVYSRLLYLRYIVGLPWLDISNDIGYEEGYTCGALHGKALQLIKQDG